MSTEPVISQDALVPAEPVAIRDDWRLNKSSWGLKIGVSSLLLAGNITFYVLNLWRVASGFTKFNAMDWVLLAFGVVYVLRTVVAISCLWTRPPAWEEMPVFLLFLPAILSSFTFGRVAWHSNVLGLVQLAVAVVLYTFGSLCNTVGEAQRKVFKAKPSNKGKLMTCGVWAWTMHPNYFGDVLLFSGWALASGCWWCWWVPLVMLLGFVFWHIPGLDEYLAQHYPDEFPAYSSSTAKLIPCLY